MFVYILLSIILFALRRNKNSSVFYICLALLFIVLAFRDFSVGTDTENYIKWFDMISMSGDVKIIDAGELFYNYIFAILDYYGLSFRWALIVQTLLFLLPISYVLRKDCKYPIMGLLFIYLLGYCFNFMNISRQMIAVSFILLAYHFLKENKLLHFCIVIFGASFIHNTAVLAAVAILFYKMKLNRKVITGALLITYIVPYLIPIHSLVLFIVERVPFLNKYAVYAEDAVAGNASFPIIPLILTCVSIYIVNKYKHIDEMYFRIAIVSIIMANFIVLTPQWTIRILLTFSVAQPIFFCNYVDNDRYSRYLALGYGFLYFFFYYVFLKYNGIYPYEFNFSF